MIIQCCVVGVNECYVSDSSLFLGLKATNACLSLKRRETMETLLCSSQRISTVLCSYKYEYIFYWKLALLMVL